MFGFWMVVVASWNPKKLDGWILIILDAGKWSKEQERPFGNNIKIFVWYTMNNEKQSMFNHFFVKNFVLFGYY